MRYEAKFTPPHLLSSLPPDTPILLALSGGADSVSLLHMLADYCKKSGAPLGVAHVNHMIRGEDALRDRDFCKRLAENYGVPFFLLEADIPSLSKEHGRGLEEEARIVRYEFFASVMRENSIPILATAHNATDNAETVIFNITRGSGLKGLCGIPPTRKFEGGTIIRPILNISKDEILKYCRENALEYVTDQTNFDVEYSRNRIRNNVLPELLKINENAVSNIGRMSNSVREDEELLTGLAKEFLSSLENEKGIPTKAFCKLDIPIQNRVAAIFLSDLFSPSALHIESFRELAQKSEEHASLSFPNQTHIEIENGFIRISDKEEAYSSSYEIKLDYGLNRIREIDAVIFVEKSDGTKNSEKEYTLLKNTYKKSATSLLSSDRIDLGLFARPKEDGDKIICGGMHKKLKKLFCEKKIPLSLRAKLPILHNSKNEIIWAPLVAICDSEKSSDKQLKITLFYN